ncbi:uncharacterized protein TNCV_3685791 [Trichonephila clavipes]|nr:uncharacterized protein TNCV_3685791 [Trichonephila clavipes]
MVCHCLQYTVTPGIDPRQHDTSAVCPLHPATTCVATYATAPRSLFSSRQCSPSHGKGFTRLSLHCYYPSLACLIHRFFYNRAYLGKFLQRVGHPTSMNKLEARLQQIWNERSQGILQNLYASVSNRIESCIRDRGDSTGY